MLLFRSEKPFDFFDEVDNFFNTTRHSLPSVGYQQKIEFKKTENGIEAKIMIPGYGKEDLEITLEYNILNISSKEDKKILQKLIVPKDIDTEKIEATCEKGILEIKAPMIKKSEKTKKQIMIT